MSLCPCGSQNTYEKCCGLYLHAYPESVCSLSHNHYEVDRGMEWRTTGTLSNTVGSMYIHFPDKHVYLEQKQQPQTPEQLMRSRYTAYSLGRIEYIKTTMKGKALIGFNESEAENWAKSVKWISLDVITTSMSSPDIGFVEFSARFFEQNQLKVIHELSEFHKENGCWFYTSGVHKQDSRKMGKPKTARNAPCPCGSGKKFKNCHAK